MLLHRLSPVDGNPHHLSFYPFVLHEISVLVELILGHLRSVAPEQGIGLCGSLRQVFASLHPLWFGLPLQLCQRPPFGGARLYLRPELTARTHAHLVVEPSHALLPTHGLGCGLPNPLDCYHRRRRRFWNGTNGSKGFPAIWSALPDVHKGATPVPD